MYLNQKNFIYNVKDLSILLVKDANLRFAEYKNRPLSGNSPKITNDDVDF